ncbi:UvrD-helicase domain-containing protein, partial [Candidatus Peregrinibacteria bacterium]|nr:UvrD-helicase domain-containing protein [Candidatus Peregrinibacteria bacterium]
QMLHASSENQYQTMLSEIYEEYQKTLKKNNALDFDDLLFFTIQIFSDFPKILEKYQNRWQYISVDEYQDTNHVQHALIKLLAKKHNNVCVVGDPDQSIYSFRGALIENILHFEKDFPAAKTIKLEQNYRSTQNILSASNGLIQNNQQSAEKRLWTESGAGDKVSIYERKDEKHESESIAKLIRSFYESNISNYSDNAILYRTNAQSRAIEEALLKYQIPYKIIGGLKFYARKEVKDILAYLRILHNPLDTISLLRIINVPARKIGKSSLVKLQSFAASRSLSLFEVMKHIDMVDNLTPAAKKAFLSFYELYEFLAKERKLHSLSSLLDLVITESGYREMLLKEKSIENQSRLENLEELKSVASRYDTLEEDSLKLFLEEVSLVQDSDSIEENDDAVLLMTIHTAKGLEFDNVYIIGVEEDLLPHSQSMNDDYSLEEERRLMYVAMTRAKKTLMIFHALQRMIYGKSSYAQPSRFIAEISADFCHYIQAYPGQAFQGHQNQGFSNPQDPDAQFYHTNSHNHESVSQDSDGYIYDEDSQV